MAECPVVKIKDGKLKGFVSQAEADNALPVYNYLSVPFGKSTEGKRRFMPPERCEPWVGVKDATKTLDYPTQNSEISLLFDDYFPMKSSLGQSFENESEDCLKLNLFTPKVSQDARLPVMVWITGGGYLRGHAGAYDGTAISGMNNVVVVCPNYRVNALGFLSLGRDSKCPGNCALLDLILALKWVQENIESFGGDSTNVTLFGESAGACLCHLLMMSPLSEGLFHKGIAFSGTILASGSEKNECWANTTIQKFLYLSSFISWMFKALFSEDLSSMTKEFLADLGITEEDPDLILEKLQNLPIEEIKRVQKPYHTLHTFFPTVDGRVLEDSPQNLAKAGKVHPIPFMLGFSDSECGGILSIVSPENFMEGCTAEDVKVVLAEAARLNFPNGPTQALVEYLMDTYTHVADKDSKYRYSKIYAEIASDSVFRVPGLLSAIGHSALKNPTYLYYMNQRLEMNHSDLNGPKIKNKHDFVNCDHGDVCHFIWGVPFIKGELPGGAWFTKEESELSRILMRYITNFAKTGNPNLGDAVTHEWPNFDPLTQWHIVLGMEIKVEQHLASDAVRLFTQTIPSLASQLSQ